MGKSTRGLFWLLGGLFLAYNLYLWGGLAVTPKVGLQLREQASLQSPIAASYLFLGRHAVVAAGLSDRATAFAVGKFSAQIANQENAPELIVQRFLAAQSGTGRLAYYGAPLLLLLSLALHATRQKPIRSFGVKD